MTGGPRARLRELARRLRLAVQYERRLRAQRAAIDSDLVVYESYAGNGMLCNPEAIFRAALAAPDLRHLQHVWALDDLDRYADTVAEFADESRVRFVQRGSSAYYRVLATAKYLVNNATFPDAWGKRDGQLYLNTWHGTPVKAMGFDVPGGALVTRNVVRNFVSADFLLAPNADTAQMYLSAYRMTNIFRGKLLTTGTPRIDKQFTDVRAEVLRRLRAAGVVVDAEDKIVLYAPTWKGDFYSPDDDLAELHRVVTAVSAALPAGRRLLVKVHQQVYEHAARDPALRPVLVPNDVPANHVLAATDVLITDYSSIFVDYLVCDRPIVFYVPDLDDYARTRGWYLPPDEWPGALCRTTDELIAALAASDGPLPDRHAAARARYCPRETGNAAERVVDVLFRGNAQPDELAADFADGRTSLLINLGGLLPNGITMSALSLLDTIDHQRYDVSVLFPHTTAPAKLRLIERINANVRLFPQPASLNGAKLRVRLLAIADARSSGGHRLRTGLIRLMRDEWRRAFGTARFDHVVDFSGYEPYWLKLLTARPAGSLSVWLHNDIAAEATNPDRPTRLRQRMRAVMSLYAAADRLVSVSAALTEVNRAGLSQYARPERFVSARNTIDAERIRRLAAEPAEPLTGAGARVFVTAGRLSGEKNHARLIRAFAAVHAEYQDTCLLVLGDGPERDRLRALAAELGVADAVVLAGHRENPYPLLAGGDCFVLSSDYEGQPIALLEALVLGLPIVTTAFASARDALPAGAGLVTECDDAGLADGLRAFLRGDVVTAPFNPTEYNATAIAEFYAALEP